MALVVVRNSLLLWPPRLNGEQRHVTFIDLWILGGTPNRTMDGDNDTQRASLESAADAERGGFPTRTRRPYIIYRPSCAVVEWLQTCTSIHLYIYLCWGSKWLPENGNRHQLILAAATFIMLCVDCWKLCSCFVVSLLLRLCWHWLHNIYYMMRVYWPDVLGRKEAGSNLHIYHFDWIDCVVRGVCVNLPSIILAKQRCEMVAAARGIQLNSKQQKTKELWSFEPASACCLGCCHQGSSNCVCRAKVM